MQNFVHLVLVNKKKKIMLIFKESQSSVFTLHALILQFIFVSVLEFSFLLQLESLLGTLAHPAQWEEVLCKD